MAAATEAVRLVLVDPQQARTLALTAAAAARADHDRAALSVAERALGLVARECQDLDGAILHLRLAIRIAARAGHPAVAAEARMSLSVVLVHRGRTAGALREADLATQVLTGPAAGMAQQQRALVLQHLGRLDEALDGYRQALPALRRAGNTLVEARVLCNRGVLHVQRGALAAAERDLLRADALFSESGQTVGVAGARHNLAWVAARRGDVPTALRWFDAADVQYRALGTRRAELLIDRAELLLSVRLLSEARRAIEDAIAELTGGGTEAGLAEARLMLAQVALLEGDPGTARDAAALAARAFARQHRPAWKALARYTLVQAAFTSGDRSAQTLRAARESAGQLAASGWVVAAIEARIVAARIALDLGRIDDAALELTIASRARNRGLADVRSRAWHAQALLHLARNQRRRAETSLRSGLQVLEDHRATIGATELRAHVSAQGVDLAVAGLRMAIEDGHVGRAFEWAERWRARSLIRRGARPPDDPELASRLTALRLVVAERKDAAKEGAGSTVLLRRQAQLEQEVRDICRRRTGDAQTAETERALSVEALGEVLGDRAMVELVELDGRLHGLTVTGEGAQLHPLGDVADAEAELRWLQSCLRRLARGHGSAPALAAARTAAHFAAGRLDGLLMRPLLDDIGDRSVVVAPTGVLHALPWSLLPSCRGRSVAVTPSARLWSTSTVARPSHDGRVVLVAGPRLAHANREIERLERDYGRATSLSGSAAGVEPVLAGLDGARLAHVAAHGSFRADNPLFSCLELADGPLTVYDLESVRRAPDLVVLSACESGLSAVHPGDELMGLAAAVLSLGTRSLIASVVAVPDEETADVMLALHRHLRAGLSPAAALATVQAGEPPGGPGGLPPAVGFVSFGAA
jgi:tetratricopeptide (TPR) repeat protein